MKKLIVFCCIVLISLQVKAQRIYDTTTTDLMGEFNKMQSFLYIRYPFTYHKLSYKTTTYIEDIDGGTVARDTVELLITSNSNYGRYRYSKIYVGKPELYSTTLQTEGIRITASAYDSIIIVEKPTSLELMLLQVNVFDTAFQQYAMSSITSSDSANCRKLTIHFDSDCPYNSYDVVYRTSDYYIIYIKSSIAKDLNSKSTSKIDTYTTFTYGSTSFIHPSDNAFENNAVEVISPNDIRPKPAAEGYEIINLLNEP